MQHRDVVSGPRSPSTLCVTGKLGALTLRAAFSHIPILQATMGMVNQIVVVPAPGNAAAPLEIHKPANGATVVRASLL